MRRRWLWWLACGALFAAFLLSRIGFSARTGLWADEVFSLAMATGHSLEHAAAAADPHRGDFVEAQDPMPAAHWRAYAEHESPPAGAGRVVRAVLMSDTSPPLYYLLLYYWTLAVGTSDLSLRMFTVVLAALCLPLLWSVGRECGGREVGAIACLLFVFAPIGLIYSTEGRMYSLVWFLVLCLAWAGLRLRSSGLSVPMLAVWVLAGVAGLLSHYFFAFALAGSGLWLLMSPGRLSRWTVLGSGCLIALLAAPYYLQVPGSLAAWRVTGTWLNQPTTWDPVASVFYLPFSFFSTRLMAVKWWYDTSVLAVMVGAFAVAAAASLPWLGRLVQRLSLAEPGLWGRLTAPPALLSWLVVLSSYMGVLAFDLWRGTWAVGVPRYITAAFPAALLLLAIVLARLKPALRASAVVAMIAVWVVSSRHAWRAPDRMYEPYQWFGELASQYAEPGGHLVIVESIPSGVIGIARYMKHDHTPVVAWVEQLGDRRSPEDVARLAGGQQRVVVVGIHEVKEPGPMRQYLLGAGELHRLQLWHASKFMVFEPRSGLARLQHSDFVEPAPEQIGMSPDWQNPRRPSTPTKSEHIGDDGRAGGLDAADRR